MEFASAVADRYAEARIIGNDTTIVDGFADELRAKSGDDDYEPARAALLYGAGFSSAKAFFDALTASGAHAALVDDASFTEFGVGYSVTRFYWVLVLAAPSANVTRPMRTTCPALSVALFMPVSSDVHKFTQLAIGQASDILADDASGAYVRNYKPCFQIATGGDAMCSSATCCPNWSLGMAPALGASAVSVAADGTCYAASSASSSAPKLYRRDPLVGDNHSSMKWQLVGGSLTRVAVGYDGVVWGISAVHRLYRLNKMTGKWIALAGEWSDVSVGSDGDVWAIEYMTQKIYRRAKGGAWQRIKGRLVDIAVGDRNNVWGVGSDAQVYVYAGDSNGWRCADETTRVIDNDKSKTAASVAVGATGFEVWLLDNTGEAHRVARPDIVAALIAASGGVAMPAFDDDAMHLMMATIVDSSNGTVDADMMTFVAPVGDAVPSEPEVGSGDSGGAPMLGHIGRFDGVANVTATTASPSSFAAMKSDATTSSNDVLLSSIVVACLLLSK